MSDKPFYKSMNNVQVVGRLTKDPHIGTGFASFSIAVNTSFKTTEGKYKDAPAEFHSVSVFDDDNYRFVQDSLYQGVVVELFGRKGYREYVDKQGEVKENWNVVVDPRNDGHYLKLATPMERKAQAKGKDDTKTPAKKPTSTSGVEAKRPTDDGDEIPF